jgi:hypothetical protein
MYIKTDCVESRIDGSFDCPICEAEQRTRKVHEKHYVTFLSFPLLTVRRIQTGVECTKCRVQFSLRQLVEHSVTKQERGQSPVVFAGSCLRSVLQMLGGSRNLNDDLVAVLQSGFATHSDGDTIEPEDIYAMRQSTIENDTSACDYVQQLLKVLTPDQRDELARHVMNSADCYNDPDLAPLSEQIVEILR